MIPPSTKLMERMNNPTIMAGIKLSMKQTVDKILKEASKGAQAGIIATVAMSFLMISMKKLGSFQKLGPQQVTEAGFNTVGLENISTRNKNIATAFAHFGFGTLLGVLFGFLSGINPNVKTVPKSILYTLAIWASGYGLTLPLLGVTPWPWRDNRTRAVSLIAEHIVYGSTLALSWNKTIAIPSIAKSFFNTKSKKGTIKRKTAFFILKKLGLIAIKNIL